MGKHKLTYTLLSLTDITPQEALISPLPCPISSAAVKQDNRGLIRLDNIHLIRKSLVLISYILIQALPPHLLR